jgi:phosphoadenosine phosphosulfate reductase
MSAQTLLAHLQGSYGELDAPALLSVMINDVFKDKIALISSFGADAAVTLSLVADISKTTPVLFLETEKHFPETLAYAQGLVDQLGLTNVKYLRPDPAMRDRIDPEGNLWQTNPNRCCWLRKVEPLERAIAELGIEAVITGRKKYQTSERHEMQTIELDEKNIFRINPIANWEKTRQQQEILLKHLPPHPLVAMGYPSIGCAPCTIAVAPGQDERAGRWAHTATDDSQKTECGLHVPTDNQGKH